MKGRILMMFLCGTTLFQCGGSKQVVSEGILEEKKAKNVILMIGDGMALSQISAAMFSSNKPMALEKFPITGLHKSHAYDDLITDSGAGATAFACGVKTFKFAIGVDKDTIPCKTILEEAEERGMATGMVVTSTIVHATPASFIAHQPMRAYHEAIAEDILKTEVDFLVGGGRRFFDKRKADDRNLVMELLNKGYEVHDIHEMPLHMVDINPSRNFVFFTGDEDPMPVTMGRDYLPYASEMATLFLRNRSREGFFLMIEGSQIDWAGHSNKGDWLIEEVLDFDKAIAGVLKLVKKRDDTLVIITADHETGGFAIQPESKFGALNTTFTSNEHTPTMVPVFAVGPGSELFSGIYENTEIYSKIRRALGWDLPEN